MNPFKKTLKNGFLDTQLTLPMAYRLLYLKFPNSEELVWSDDSILEDHMYWGAWSIPRYSVDWTGANRDLFFILGVGPFFNSDGTSKIVTGSDILLVLGINTGNMQFSWRKGLSLFDTSVTSSVLTKARKYHRLT